MKQIKLKYKKYPEYKHSGVEWLGEIPKHWEVKRLKYLGKMYAGLSDKKGDDFSKEFQEDKKPFIPFTNIFKNTIIDEGDFQYVKIKPNEKQNVVKKGDILFLMSSETIEDIGKTSLYNGEKKVYLNSFCKGFRIKGNSNNAYFLNWLLQTNAYRIYFSMVARGFTRINIKQEYVNNTLTLLPPLPEQTAIAEFLDDKTAKIDRAIAQKEKLIALLKERKQIIIQNAVTKGLNPNVKLKDSGVEWIGKIPEHWEVKKLFGLCRFVRGNSSFSKDELLSKGKYVALQYGKCYKINEVDENYKFYVNNEFYKDSQIVNYGDVIFISTSETIEDLGHSVFYKRNDLGLLGGEQILLKPKIAIINSKYLFYSSKVFSKEIRKYATGIKVFRFNINDLKTIYIPLPKKNEQKQIVAYIEEQSAKIDKAISLQQKQIEKLKEYKTVLIDNAVTGKIKVF